MSELFAPAVAAGLTPTSLAILGRLLGAMVLGWAVVAVYRRTRQPDEVAPSFTVTLVLLAILIAMVTQVIGDNVARAFSLVGALSIVRFRTVVRDTEDTAYVICAVAIGMAVGAGHPFLAMTGIVVVALAAFLLRDGAALAASGLAADLDYSLTVRLGLGSEPDALLARTFDTHLRGRRLLGLATARQGLSVDATYRVGLRTTASAGGLVLALNRIDGVQSVMLQHVDVNAD